jgi:parvulin-like peptidyl-prolyl isomerase
MRSIALLLFTVVVAVGGCGPLTTPGQSGSAPIAPTAEPAPPTPQRETTTAPTAATRPTTGAVMAYVNGRPIYMRPLHEMLVRAHGVEQAQQLIASELVAQAAEDQNLTASDAEIAAEHERTLERMFPDNVSGAEQRERLLEQLMVQKGVPREEWRMTMRRNVLLGKLAVPRAAVSEAELRTQFEERYGRKFVVRHIQTASLSDAQNALEQLREGADFAQLARKVSKSRSAATGGLLQPIGPKAPGLPPPLREAARSLKTPGEISEPIQVGTTYHVLHLERIVEAQDVKFEDVKDSLAEAVRDDKLQALKPQILAELIRRARIEYVDPILKIKSKAAEPGEEVRP